MVQNGLKVGLSGLKWFKNSSKLFKSGLIGLNQLKSGFKWFKTV